MQGRRGCRDVGADVLCPTHRNMQATIRAAQRGPVPKAAVDAFLDALARGYGEGEGHAGPLPRAPGRAGPGPDPQAGVVMSGTCMALRTCTQCGDQREVPALQHVPVQHAVGLDDDGRVTNPPICSNRMRWL